MGSKRMRVSRGCQGWGIVLDYGGACVLAGFSLYINKIYYTITFLMHHSCKFVVLSRLICLHFRGFVAKEEIGLKVSRTSGGSMLRVLTVNLMN